MSSLLPTTLNLACPSQSPPVVVGICYSLNLPSTCSLSHVVSWFFIFCLFHFWYILHMSLLIKTLVFDFWNFAWFVVMFLFRFILGRLFFVIFLLYDLPLYLLTISALLSCHFRLRTAPISSHIYVAFVTKRHGTVRWFNTSPMPMHVCALAWRDGGLGDMGQWCVFARQTHASHPISQGRQASFIHLCLAACAVLHAACCFPFHALIPSPLSLCLSLPTKSHTQAGSLPGISLARPSAQPSYYLPSLPLSSLLSLPLPHLPSCRLPAVWQHTCPHICAYCMHAFYCFP